MDTSQEPGEASPRPQLLAQSVFRMQSECIKKEYLLCEISQTEKDKYYMELLNHLYVESFIFKKIIETVERWLLGVEVWGK